MKKNHSHKKLSQTNNNSNYNKYKNAIDKKNESNLSKSS